MKIAYLSGLWKLPTYQVYENCLPIRFMKTVDLSGLWKLSTYQVSVIGARVSEVSWRTQAQGSKHSASSLQHPPNRQAPMTQTGQVHNFHLPSFMGPSVAGKRVPPGKCALVLCCPIKSGLLLNLLCVWPLLHAPVFRCLRNFVLL